MWVKYRTNNGWRVLKATNIEYNKASQMVTVCDQNGNEWDIKCTKRGADDMWDALCKESVWFDLSEYQAENE